MTPQQPLYMLAISVFRPFGFCLDQAIKTKIKIRKKHENGHLQCLLGVINFGVLFADSFLSDQNNKTKTKNEKKNGLGIERTDVVVGSCTTISVNNKNTLQETGSFIKFKKEIFISLSFNSI